MKRDYYYKEGDTEYGRPRTRIAKRPPGFSLVDTSGWDARRFLKELAIRQGRHEWAQQQAEWVLPRYRRVEEGDKWRAEQDGVVPMFSPDATPITDPDEINRFLARPPAVSRITSEEQAAHALALGMILIAVDPHTPGLVERLNAEAKDIRAKHPPSIKDRWRPSTSTDVAGIDDQKVEQWRDHRIVDLYDFIIKGHDPGKERPQLARWLFQDVFPNAQDRRARGKKLDRAVELLNEALASMRMIDAQTRKGPQRRESLMDYVAGVIKKQLDALDETRRLSTTRKITVVPVVIKDAVPIVDEKVPLRSRT
jgi:hypothetical protein